MKVKSWNWNIIKYLCHTSYMLMTLKFWNWNLKIIKLKLKYLWHTYDMLMTYLWNTYDILMKLCIKWNGNTGDIKFYKNEHDFNKALEILWKIESLKNLCDFNTRGHGFFKILFLLKDYENWFCFKKQRYSRSWIF